MTFKEYMVRCFGYTKLTSFFQIVFMRQKTSNLFINVEIPHLLRFDFIY